MYGLRLLLLLLLALHVTLVKLDLVDHQGFLLLVGQLEHFAECVYGLNPGFMLRLGIEVFEEEAFNDVKVDLRP